MSYRYQYKDIGTELLNNIQGLTPNRAGEHSKPVYVSTILHHDAQKQLESCLRQENQEHSGERILLLPYQLENYQWAGILLEFNTNNLIERAEYIDPMTDAETIPNEIQESFSKVYPPNILQIRQMKKSNDTTNSANLTVVNLLEAATFRPTTQEDNQQNTGESHETSNRGLGEHNLDDIGELDFTYKQSHMHEGRRNIDSDEISFGSTAIESPSPAFPSIPRHTSSDEQIRSRVYTDELRHDLASMPECSEKTVLELLEECTSSQKKNMSKTLLRKLHEQVQREKCLSEKVRTICKELEVHVAGNDDRAILRCLEKLLREIRPLNVVEIVRLISKAHQAAELIHGKDIVLLIGPTGSGKSTTVQFLAGCRMITTDVEIAPGKSLQNITADEISSSSIQLDGIRSSPFSRSETRYIAPVTVQLRDIIGPHENGTIILCDGPGFGDTAGPEVDIANSLGVIEALKQARSVKLLVLSSFDTLGGRGEGIQKLARILINMIDDINERLGAVFYAFTKYPSERNINSLLTDIKRSKVDADPILQSDEPFNAILTDMIEKSTDRCCKVDPLKDSPKALLKKLKQMKGIQHPSETFRFPMNDETQNMIDKHVQRNRNHVEYAMKNKDNQLVMYYLKDFRRLVDLIQKDTIRREYEDLGRSIGENVNEYCNVEVNKFNRLIASQDGLREEDVHDYKVSVEYLQQMQIIKEDLELSLPSPSILTQNIITQLKHRRTTLNDEDLSSPLVGIYLDNFLMIKTAFTEFEIDYQNSCAEFEKRFDDLVQSAHDAIAANDFERLNEFLFKISKSLETLQKHLQRSPAKKYVDIIEELLAQLLHLSDKVDSIFLKDSLTIDDIQILMNDIEILKLAKENYALRENVAKYTQMLKGRGENPADLDGIYEQYLAKSVKYVDDVSERIRVILEANEDYALENIEKFVNNMNTIRAIPEIEFKTVRVYYNTIENIRKYMQQLQPHTQQLLQSMSIDQQSGNVDDRQLVRLFSSLKNTKWIESISPGTYEMSYVRLRQELIDFGQQLQNRLKKLDLSSKSPDNVPVAHDILEKLEYVCTLQEHIPELEQYQEESLEYFVKRVQKVFAGIRKDFGVSANTVALEAQNSLTEDSDSDDELLDTVKIPYSSKRKKVLETIRDDRRLLNEQITKMNVYVDVYNGLLDSRSTNPIRFLTRSFRRASNSQKVQDAMNYIQAHGFESIDALKKTIWKFKVELQSLEEHERQFFLTESYSETKTERTSNVTEPSSNKVRLSQANDALMYAEHCEKIRCERVQEAVIDIHKILQNYLDKYIMSLVEQKIIENFNRIFRTEHQQESEPYQYALELELGLHELHSLRKLNSVFRCIDGDEKIERCQQVFFRGFRMLSTNLEQYKANEKSKELRKQLTIAQILSCVDHFCGTEFEWNGYGALYGKYQSELIEGCAQICITILEYIGRKEYANVALALPQIDDELANDRAMAQIKHDLDCSLNKLMNDIEYSTNSLNDRVENEESLRRYVAEIRENIEAFRCVLNRPIILDLLEKKTKHSIESFIEKLISIFSTSFLISLNSIETLINNANFPEAEKEMLSLKYLQREFSSFFVSEVVVRKSQILTERLNDIVSEVLKQNDFSDVSNYLINPPKDILNKLATTAGSYGEKYATAYKHILVHIKDKFTLAMTNVRELPLVERALRTRLLEQALQYLPEELRDSFRLELEELKRSISEEERIYREKLDMCFNDVEDDEHMIERIGELAVQLEKQKLNEQLNELCNRTLKRLYVHRTNVRAALDQRDTRLAIEILGKIIRYEMHLSGYIVEIKEVGESVRVLLNRTFQSWCKTVAHVSLIDERRAVRKAFDEIMLYFDFTADFEAFFSSIDSKSSMEDIEKMFQYFHANSEQFRVVFKEMNVAQMYKIMHISRKWDTFVEKLKQSRTKHSGLQQLLTQVRNVIQYRDMVSELENQLNHLKSQVEVELINNETSRFEIKRYELHSNITTSVRVLKAIDAKFRQVLPSMFDVAELERSLNEKVQQICTELISKASLEQLSTRDTDDFRMFYNHLLSLRKCIPFLTVDIPHFLELAEEKISEKIRALRARMSTNQIPVSDVARILCQMKFLAENLSMFDREVNSKIDEALKTYKDKYGMLTLMKLVVELEASDLGRRLINEHSCLTGESWKRRRDKMQKQDDLEHVLKELNGDDISREKLRTRYRTFREKYDELVSNNLKVLCSNTNEQADVDGLVTQVKFAVSSLIHTSKPGNWKHAFIDEIPQVLAYIFAIWTLKNTQHYNTMRGIEAAQSYLLIPHVAQVIAVFRLLGIGYNSRGTLAKRNVTIISSSLVNNLVEIGTGEGKSVVMAITACVFALTGVDVNCSCYSKVLSTRDQGEFASVFRALGVEDRIQYGTFDALCEQFLNEQCDVRVKVRQMIEKNKSALKKIDMTMSTRPKVLLIDEVDVFLSDQYYGGMYNPAVVLKDPPIKALLDAIWQNKTLQSLNDIRSLPAYKRCTTQYSHWVFLFDEAIKDMLADLHSYKMSKYIVQNDRICYIKGEMVTDSLIYGYNTMWAYYHEHEKGNITSDSLGKNVGLIVDCGTFSYAEIPHEFSYIAGVTGTLRTLAQSEEGILKNTYAIERKTMMPSVFGKSNRTYDSTTDVHVVSESDYFVRIRAEIDRVRIAGRAILVFFESEKELTNFSDSPELASIKEDVQIVTERVDVKERELYIKRSSTVGKVTLLTRIFGRGTDFVCDNRDILEHGGFHVLQTFFSRELAEEYQIMGRTARQGDRGSYGMVLLDKDLEWVLGSTWQNEISNVSSAKLYEMINASRAALYETKCATKGLSIAQCQNEHKLSRAFMTAICQGDMKSIETFLKDRNRGAHIVENPVRTILLLSGKSSRFTVLDVINGTISTILERASVILEQMGLNSSVIQIQLVIDRNDNSTQNNRMQISPWCSRARDLETFINTAGNNTPSFGPSSTGLEHAVRASRQGESISQVIMIGDTLATYPSAMLEPLRAKYIPVHTFYLNSYVRDNFQEIAGSTGGRCMGQRGYSSRCAGLVTNFVAEKIIGKVAGIARDAAVELYRAKYVSN